MPKARIPLSLAASLGGLLVGAALLHLCVGDPFPLYAGMRSEKLHLIQDWSGRADTAVFGSSHVHNGFDPRSFDRALLTAGVERKTLNLGIEGGAQTEQRQMALRFLQSVAPNSHPVALLELNAGANLTNDHLMHPRSINLYDLPTLRFVWTLRQPGRSGVKRTLGRRTFAVAAWMLHSLNFGMISSRIFSPMLDADEVVQETRDDRRGLLQPTEAADKDQKNQASINRAHGQKASTEVGEIDLGARVLAEELERQSPAQNVQVVYFVMPRLSDISHRVTWPRCIDTAHGPVPVIAINRPEVYPELYSTPGYWTDDSHMDDAGAAFVGRAIAEQWLVWIKTGGAASAGSCGA